MASFYSIMGQLQKSIEAALTTPPIVVDGVTVVPAVGVGWPSVNILQDVARGPNVPVSIYDRKIRRNTTRWLPEVIAQSVTVATLTSALSRASIGPDMAAVLTLGGTITAGDAVSFIAGGVLGTAAQVAVSQSGDDLPAMAARLAAQINADATLNTQVDAEASGAAVTITNMGARALNLQSYTGNGGTQTREIGRREASVQVICWARTENIREAVVNVITGLLASAELNFGITMPDGTIARLENTADFDIEDDTLEDVYRHDFVISLEYAVTVQDQLFAILAPVENFTIETIIEA